MPFNPYSVDALMHNVQHYHNSTFWCRYHKRAEKGSWAMTTACIRIGPFVDEEEASAAGEALAIAPLPHSRKL